MRPPERSESIGITELAQTPEILSYWPPLSYLPQSERLGELLHNVYYVK
jgi:hypothetical protein